MFRDKQELFSVALSLLARISRNTHPKASLLEAGEYEAIEPCAEKGFNHRKDRADKTSLVFREEELRSFDTKSPSNSFAVC